MLVIPIRALLAWIYNRTGSIAFVGLVHAASNASAFGLVPELDHRTGDARLPFLVLAIAAIAFTRDRLAVRDWRAQTTPANPANGSAADQIGAEEAAMRS